MAGDLMAFGMHPLEPSVSLFCLDKNIQGQGCSL